MFNTSCSESRKLANNYESSRKYDMFCGREIKNAVKDACIVCAMNEREIVAQNDLMRAAEKVKTESEKVANASDHTQSTLKVLLQKKLDEHKAEGENNPPSE